METSALFTSHSQSPQQRVSSLFHYCKLMMIRCWSIFSGCAAYWAGLDKPVLAIAHCGHWWQVASNSSLRLCFAVKRRRHAIDTVGCAPLMVSFMVR